MAPASAPDGPLELRCRVPSWAHGMLLIRFLQQRFRYRDEAGWRDELAGGRVCVDDQPAQADSELQRGQTVCYTTHHDEPAVDLEVPISYQDTDLAVVAKPALLPCHSDGPFVRHTMVFQLQAELGKVRLVHRLDRETSGVMVVARTAATQRGLAEQFRDGAVAKVYLAVVAGRVDRDFEANGAIGRDSDSAISLRRAVVAADTPDARLARTRFELLAASDRCTLLRCRPATGRTHQIRVHLAHAGHPILGDKLYGRTDAQYLDFVRHVKAGGSARFSPDGGPDRQLLHAHSLRFTHPRTREQISYEVAPPSDLTRWAPGEVPG